MADSDVGALINHYAREGLWRHIQTTCAGVMEKLGRDPELLFWRAFSMAAEGSIAEAIRELEALRAKRDMEYPAMVALLDVHQKESYVDSTAVMELEADLPGAASRAAADASLLTARYYAVSGNASEARRILGRMLERDPDNTKALVVQGWVNLASGRRSRRGVELINSAKEAFDRALELSPSGRHLEATMGRAKYYELKRDFRRCLEALSLAVVQFGWYLPALSEKAKVLIMMKEWEQGRETALRVLEEDREDVTALRICSMYHLTREAAGDTAVSMLGRLAAALFSKEPKNAALFFRVSQPFARVAGRLDGVLAVTRSLLDRARLMEPSNSAFVAEVAYQLSLEGSYAEALELYNEAVSLDPENAAALRGTIFCHIQQGLLEEASTQLEMLKTVVGDDDASASHPEMLFLDALLAWRVAEDREAELAALDATVAAQRKLLRDPDTAPSDTYEFFVRFNPDFLLSVAREYLQHCGMEPLDPSDPVAAPLGRATTLLKQVTQQVPGLLAGQLLLARAWFIADDADAAVRVLTTCLSLDGRSAEVHLLFARIHVHRNSFSAAADSLREALSADLDSRSSPSFLLLEAEVQIGTGAVEDALKTLHRAIELPGVRELAPVSFGRVPEPVPLAVRASVFIKLAQLHAKAMHVAEAVKLIRDATRIFEGTSEHVRVLIATAELHVKRGDVPAAISLLSTVAPGTPAFSRAQTVKADILLKERKDKRGYVQCYRELVELNPSAHTHTLLAEAFMRIHDPDSAIRAYESAMELNPADHSLASKIGMALISTHNYVRAIDYYEKALRATPERVQLRYDLADLYSRLRRYDAAARVLEDALVGRDAEAEEDVSLLINDVRVLMLLSKVHTGDSRPEEADSALQRARLIQRSVLSKLGSRLPEKVREQKRVAADICFQLASIQASMHGRDRDATEMYNEALRFDESHVASLLALARGALRRDDQEACQQHCITLMRIEPSNEEASLMMAEVMFRKQQFEAASYHFSTLLTSQPDNWSVLHQLMMLKMRSGHMDDIEGLLKRAVRAKPRAAHTPGYHFCSGVWFRMQNDVHQAISHFNRARRDAEWGPRAVLNMAELYINPEKDVVVEGGGGDGRNLAIVNALLSEMPPSAFPRRRQVLECYSQMATNQRVNIDYATERLVEMVGEDPEYVPALLALATGMLLLKHTPKARGFLRRVDSWRYNVEYAVEFERCWLLLADIYIAASKYDKAEALCKKALKFNQSCGKACEYLGLVKEKESAYRDAAGYYEQAWKLESEKNPAVGYKLAFNYLKARRHLDAIDVCHKVLKDFPDYPKIKRDILEKARLALRM